ncbi:calcium-binding protein [Roseibium sp. RKSG952]|uniref:calcium-binding protein n=1 Tax=Roseibium sp. RKSG952 TaxID=2529384 RepID=UPI0012BD6FDB|nr:calcium-binding protein [Roseibium sp. RKSG952]MTH95016.1 calcium-binding protein [Roseibium sp. RKSG952]
MTTIAVTGASTYFWAVYSVASGIYNVLDEAGSEAETIDTSDSTPGYTTVEDFNPTTDVLILPIYSSDLSNVSVTDSLDGSGDITIIYQNGTTTNIVAYVNFDDASEVFGGDVTTWSSALQEAFYYSMIQNAFVVTEDGEAYYLESGGSVDIDTSTVSSLDEDSTAYLVMGATYGWYVYGTTDTTYLVGNNYDDIIYGYIPDSSIAGYVGAEDSVSQKIYGFDGDDWIQAGYGDDYIFGGSGNNTSAYTDSTDSIYVDMSTTYEDENGTYFLAEDGLGTTDQLYNIQNIWGSDYDDTIIGDDEDNIFYGFGGDDLIYGGGGDDTIYAGSGYDTIYGGDGDDTIYAGTDGGYFDGGDGTDTLILNESESAVTVSVSGSTGTVSYEDGSEATFVNFEEIDGSEYDDTISLAGADSGYIVFGDSGDDTIIGSDYDDTLKGGDGDDTIYSGGGNNTVYGGDGDDIIYIGDGENTVYGGEGTTRSM